ncbi:hypothetical protein HZC09_00525 [Candidatus Micrarchaeota archaeon]|nr:hypothetical protein [Candidatus Micrarchaeota archaeon]
MKVLLIVSLVFFAAVFVGVYAYNSAYPDKIVLQPPYAYVPGDMASEASSLVFVFVLSLLFFGYSAPIALGIEAAKYASMISTNALPVTHAAFILPAMLASVAAVYLGQGLLKDYKGEGNWIDYAQKSAYYMIAALVIWLIVFFGRNYIPL